VEIQYGVLGVVDVGPVSPVLTFAVAVHAERLVLVMLVISLLALGVAIWGVLGA